MNPLFDLVEQGYLPGNDIGIILMTNSLGRHCSPLLRLREKTLVLEIKRNRFSFTRKTN